MQINNSNELAHWGIKGMRWGVRRFQNKDGSLTKAGRKRYETDSSDEGEKNTTTPDGGSSTSSATAAKSKPKKVKAMTDEEIKERLARLKLEKEYRDTLQGSKSKGKKFAEDVMEQIGRNTLTNVGTQIVNSGLTFATNKLMKSILGSTKKLDDKAIEKWMDEYKLYTNNKKKS